MMGIILKLKLLCRNIRHALFQKATKSEVACIVHFHLHNPIMVRLTLMTSHPTYLTATSSCCSEHVI